MYLILHAFSRRNAGDGLLVDLTLEALADAGISSTECTVLALDAKSFGDLERVIQAPGEPRAVPSAQLIGAMGELAANLTGHGEVESLARYARGFIAVGGGYLVADGLLRQAGVMLNHFVQLRAAASSQAPSVYLPQSVGPLDFPASHFVRRELRRLDRFYVRDDLTFRELAWPNIRRCADLAVMKLARSLNVGQREAGVAGPCVIVARHLPHAGDYETRLRDLQARFYEPLWAMQADVEGPRSDRRFYDLIGVKDSGPLSTVLETRPAVVISVRLHGAIAALLAGVPAIHLAYERKGWGAYEDLGLQEYVHDARTFDPALVAAQAERLRANPEPMWKLLAASRQRLVEQYAALVDDLRSFLIR